MNRLRLTGIGLLLGGWLVVGAGCTPKPVLVLPRPKDLPPPAVVQLPPPEDHRQEAVAATQEPVPEKKVVARGPEIGQVAKRLAVYEGRLYRWGALTAQMTAQGEELPDGWQQCRDRLQSAYNSYSLLRQHLTTSGREFAVGSDIDPWAVVGEDFGYEESGCRELLAARVKSATAGQEQKKTVPARQLVATFHEDVARGRYQQALEVHGNLARVTDVDLLGSAVGRDYGMALLRTDQVDAALAQFQKVLASPDGKVAGWKLRRQVADLLLATGHLDEAVKQYQALAAFFSGQGEDRDWVQGQLALLANGDNQADALKSYCAALRAYLSFDGRRVPGELKMWVARLEYATPDSDFTHRARQLLDRAEKESRNWVSDRLREVDGLVDAKEYRHALAKLENLSGEDLPQETAEVVQKAIDEVVVGEALEKEGRRQRANQALTDRWQEALHLFASQKYDEAIKVFSSLYETDYDGRAREKVGEAASQAATVLRRQAAAEFLKAGQATDVAQQKEALLESQRLLQSILDKYPYVDLVDKVTANLQVIHEQLQALAPPPGWMDDGGTGSDSSSARSEHGQGGDEAGFAW